MTSLKRSKAFSGEVYGISEAFSKKNGAVFMKRATFSRKDFESKTVIGKLT